MKIRETFFLACFYFSFRIFFFFAFFGVFLCAASNGAFTAVRGSFGAPVRRPAPYVYVDSQSFKLLKYKYFYGISNTLYFLSITYTTYLNVFFNRIEIFNFVFRY